MDEVGHAQSVTRLGLLLPNPLPAGLGEGVLESAAGIAHHAEEAGFDSLWLSDRIVPSEEDSPVRNADGYEAYSLLGALAARTRWLRLGVFPRSFDDRSPAIVAKMVTGVDVISHGRALLTLAFDPEDGVRGVERLAEGLEVCRAVLEDERPEFVGRFFAIDGAFNRPRPSQPGGVPLVVLLDRGDLDLDPDSSPGPGPGELRIEGLKAAAHWAQAVVVGADATAVESAVEVVRSTPAVPVGKGRSRGGSPSPAVQVIAFAAVGVDNGGFARPESSMPDFSAEVPDVADVADRLSQCLQAGAHGCIVSCAGTNQLDLIVRYGRAMNAAIRAVGETVRPPDRPEPQ